MHLPATSSASSSSSSTSSSHPPPPHSRRLLRRRRLMLGMLLLLLVVLPASFRLRDPAATLQQYVGRLSWNNDDDAAARAGRQQRKRRRPPEIGTFIVGVVSSARAVAAAAASSSVEEGSPRPTQWAPREARCILPPDRNPGQTPPHPPPSFIFLVFSAPAPHNHRDFGRDRRQRLSPQTVWLATFPNSGTSYTLMMVRRASGRAVASNYGMEAVLPRTPPFVFVTNATSVPVDPDRPVGEGPFWRCRRPGEESQVDDEEGEGDGDGEIGQGPARRGRLVPWQRWWTRRGSGVVTHSAEAAEAIAIAANTSRRADPDEEDLPLPDRLVLTKTHCGVRCVHCPPSDYLTNASEFLDECLATYGVVVPKGGPLRPRGGGAAAVVTSRTIMDVDRLAKMVHLVRNPYHNVVARYHLDRKNMLQRRPGLHAQLPDNATGFQRWCHLLDEQNEAQWRWDNAETQRLMDQVPCRGELYRYVLWHELALAIPETVDGLRRRRQLGRINSTTTSTTTSVAADDTDVRPRALPVLRMHYEDYQGGRFNETTSRLLEFLELDVVSPPSLEPFRPLPTYEGYYRPDQIDAIRDLVHHLASEELWEILRRYF